MGLISALGRKKTYLDTNIFIYALEGLERFDVELEQLLSHVDQGRLDVVTSELTLAEMLVKPLKENKKAQAETYKRFLQTRPHFHVGPVSRPVLRDAARLRGVTSLKLPDAIHAATALHYECEVFLTNDDRIKSIPGLDVVQLSTVVDT